MISVLDMPQEELLAIVEARAAAGDSRAERLLRTLLEEEAETGELTVFGRLACTPYVHGDRHSERRGETHDD